MELTGGADCGALGGDEKSEQVEEEVASGGSVRVERFVRCRIRFMFTNPYWRLGLLYIPSDLQIQSLLRLTA